ncbi:MAG TPA: SCO family protein [Chthoniobacteraceae bacterium]|jgi:protein SCO1/2|nr:SCO family protein [Chthoniobacteraceae bacterium]
MYSKKKTIGIYLAMLATAVFAGAVTLMQLRPHQPALPVIAALPAFQAVNQDGRHVTGDDFRGHVWLASFVYTTCPGPCPVITAHMAELSHKLPPGVMIASFSTDPAHDTPAVLKAYAAKYHAGAQWMFLTGPAAQQYDLINHGFLMAASAPAGAPILHSTQIALVDQSGGIRGYYDGISRGDDDTILADIKRLLDR